MQPLTPQQPPRSIMIIGWATIAASAIMIVVNLMSLASSSILDSLGGALGAQLSPQSFPESMKHVFQMYEYSRWWTWYGIGYFCFLLVAAIQFLRLRAWGRSALEVACWIGLMNAMVDTTLSIWIWKSTQEALSMVLRNFGGGQYTFLSPLGFITIGAGFLLWIVPSAAMIWYLRKPAIRQLFVIR
jgi:hypothetical protein